MDDWVLATLNIPSVTAELGRENQYIYEWEIKDYQTGFDIVEENQPWLESVY
jgi:soluble cytochrome b562